MENIMDIIMRKRYSMYEDQNTGEKPLSVHLFRTSFVSLAKRDVPEETGIKERDALKNMKTTSKVYQVGLPTIR